MIDILVIVGVVITGICQAVALVILIGRMIHRWINR
jgi:hypothetical protein